MSAAPAPAIDDHDHADSWPAPLAIFRLRTWARAYLWASCMMTLHDAADELQLAAERSGLVDELGQDGVQELIAAEFEAANG